MVRAFQLLSKRSQKTMSVESTLLHDWHLWSTWVHAAGRDESRHSVPCEMKRSSLLACTANGFWLDGTVHGREERRGWVRRATDLPTFLTPQPHQYLVNLPISTNGSMASSRQPNLVAKYTQLGYQNCFGCCHITNRGCDKLARTRLAVPLGQDIPDSSRDEPPGAWNANGNITPKVPIRGTV